MQGVHDKTQNKSTRLTNVRIQMTGKISARKRIIFICMDGIYIQHSTSLCTYSFKQTVDYYMVEVVMSLCVLPTLVLLLLLLLRKFI